jgi:AcrR family transcriptional regulator
MRQTQLRPTRRRIQRAALKLFVERDSKQLTVSELAAAAGVARGTIYSNLPGAEALFDEVAEQLVDEMSERLELSFKAVEDPAARMAQGVRHYVRRAHDEPEWGRFMTRFAHNCRPLQRLWATGPGDNLRTGMRQGRYAVRASQTRAAMGMIAGGVIGAMAAVLEGDLTWRAAGSDTAELLLIALGIDRKEARGFASAPLPPLPKLV